MQLDSAQIGTLVGAFMWPFLRISALFIVMPVIGGRMLLTRIRILYAFILALTIAPLAPNVPEIDLLSSSAVFVAFHELLVGVSMGLCLQFIFSTLVAAGEQISLSTGLGFASMVDPQNGVNVPVISQMLVIFGSILYFVTGLHDQVIEILMQSFTYTPIQIMAFDTQTAWQIVLGMSEVMARAVSLAIPVTSNVLLVYLCLGVMTRSAPQLNVFSVGFPITLLVGLIILTLVLPSYNLGFFTVSTSFLSLLRDVVGI